SDGNGPSADGIRPVRCLAVRDRIRPKRRPCSADLRSGNARCHTFLKPGLLIAHCSDGLVADLRIVLDAWRLSELLHDSRVPESKVLLVSQTIPEFGGHIRIVIPKIGLDLCANL